MTARPTTAQKTALNTAMNNNRIGDATQYADRTLSTMQRNGWITRPDTNTYRIAPEGAMIIGQITLADRYRREDLLAIDPKAQRQAAVVAQAHEVGISAFCQIGETGTVSISVEDLARLLAISHTLIYVA